MNNLKKIQIYLLAFLFVASPVFVIAQVPPLEKPVGPGTSADKPLIECGGVTSAGVEQPPCDAGHFAKLIQDLLNLAFLFAGFIVAGMFMYAGFLLITAGGDTGKIQKARTIFKRVAIGFLIMFMSYLLIKNLLEKLNLNADVKSLFMGLIK
jgi:hypothetical protein